MTLFRAMSSTKPETNLHRAAEIDDLAAAALSAVLRENRALSSALASVGLGAGLAITGGAMLMLDFTDVVNWPLTALAIVSGATGAGAALTALGSWQWRKAEKRLKGLEAKLYATWYLQREIDASSDIENKDVQDCTTSDAFAAQAFGRKHVVQAQEQAEALLRRVMQRPTGPR